MIRQKLTIFGYDWIFETAARTWRWPFDGLKIASPGIFLLFNRGLEPNRCRP